MLKSLPAALKLAADLQLLSALIQTGFTNSRAADLVRRSILRHGRAVFGRACTFDSHGCLTGLSLAEVDAVLSAQSELAMLRREQRARTDAARRERAEQERVTRATVDALQFGAGVTA